MWHVHVNPANFLTVYKDSESNYLVALWRTVAASVPYAEGDLIEVRKEYIKASSFTEAARRAIDLFTEDLSWS